jgi:hypothetical protein
MPTCHPSTTSVGSAWNAHPFGQLRQPPGARLHGSSSSSPTRRHDSRSPIRRRRLADSQRRSPSGRPAGRRTHPHPEQAHNTRWSTGPGRALCDPSSGATSHPRMAVHPVSASVLDVRLTSAPKPDHRFALGWDAPRPFAMHSTTAHLAPKSGALLHVLGYIDGDVPVSREDLEALLDDRQPGWRNVVRHARYLPAVTVTHDHPQPHRSADQLRDDVWIAGDGVGPTGLLTDCAAESALHSASAVSTALGVAARIQPRCLNRSETPSGVPRMPSPVWPKTPMTSFKTPSFCP